jgi:hypothetical protein
MANIIVFILLFLFSFSIDAQQSSNDTKQVKVSSADTTPKFLENKITAGSGVTITKQNTGANESLQISSSGAVSSVSAGNSSLTVSPTTGAVSASLNLANSNTFTAAQSVSRSLTATTGDGLICENPTAATSGNQKSSPSLRFRGRGWKTNSTAGSQTVDFQLYNLPVQGAANPTGRLITQSSINGASYNDIESIDTLGQKTITTLSGATTSLKLNFNASNSSAGTTEHLRTDNTGSNTFFSNYFSNSLRSAIGFNSGGSMNFYMNSNNGVNYFNGTVSSPTQFAYNYPSVFGHYGFGGFNGGVNAGSTGTPTSTLENNGTLENKTIYINSSTTLSDANKATNILCDASSAACTGSPTRACSYWTNSTDCGLRGNHGGGCSWFSGYDCSAFNNESGMSSCQSQSGCTAVTESCSTYGNSDQTTCESQDDAYGGSCSWSNSPTDCNVYNSDQGGCESNSSYCTWYPATTADCSSFSYTDQLTCESYSGCSWSDPDCSGSYETAASYCSGTIDNFICDGTYFNGSCSGSYGAACTGTPTCTGIGNSTDCGNELGCTWATVLNLTLNSNPPSGREYKIKNISSGGQDVIIYPNTGNDIDGDSSLTLANYKDSKTLVYHEEAVSCSTFNEAACTPTGCSISNANCSWDSMSSVCSGNAACDGIGDQPTCEGTQYFSSCVGNWYRFKRWHVFE